MNIELSGETADIYAIDFAHRCNAVIGIYSCRSVLRESLDSVVLKGLKFGAKDNIDVAGIVTSGGTVRFEQNIAPNNADVIEKLFAAGAEFWCKTALHELSLGTTGEATAFGTVRNPLDSTRSAGGSSSGSGVMTSLGLVDFALGTDTGGSARIPASFCGVYGFRPSAGRYSQSGVIGVSAWRDTVGVLSRDIDVIRRVDLAVAGVSHGGSIERGSRLGLPKEFWVNLDPVVKKACTNALDKLTALGYQLVEIDPGALFNRMNSLADMLTRHEVVGSIERYLTESGSGIPVAEVLDNVSTPSVKDFLNSLSAVERSGDDLGTIRDAASKIRELYNLMLEQYSLSALVYPTTPILAPKLSQLRRIQHNGVNSDTFRLSLRNLEVSTVAGTPSISVPVATIGSKLTAALCFEGRFNSDSSLLEFVAGLEGGL